MKAVLEDLGGSQKKLVFEIPPEEVQEEVDKYCRKLAKEVDIRGFRKGKAPPSVIKRYFRERIRGEVATQLVSASLEKALKEHALTPVGEPEIDMPPLEEGKGFPFTVTVDVKPQIDVKDYRGVSPAAEPVEVTEEEVGKSLEELQRAHAQLQGIEADRPAAPGDVVLVDYAAFLDDRPVPGTEKQDAYIEIGAGAHKRDVEEKLIGATVGATREAEVEYPDNFVNKALAGKKVQYRFVVKNLFEKKLPNLDDEFAKDVGAYENLEALKARMREEIRREKESRARKRREEGLLDTILERNPFEAPRAMVKARKEQLIADARGHFLSQGLTLEKESEGFQRLETEFDSLADKEVRKHLVLEAIAAKESIAVSDLELEAEIARLAERHHQTVEKVRADILKQEDGLERLRHSLQLAKTLDFLMPGGTID
jgi:trigger factor